MKINFGKLKGRKILIGKNKRMRPTQELNKKKIFSLIEIDANDVVLDLFSGTGALGFEAASLGAKEVIWVDNNIASTLSISKTIKSLQLDAENFKVYKKDFREALKTLDIKPTIIFLDPPFIATNYYDQSLTLIETKKKLSKDGIIVLEMEKIKELKLPSEFIIKSTRKIGNKKLIFIQWKEHYE